MVFKNPYIYLIKHFKFIHLILTALFIYLTIKVSGVLGYYNSFIAGSASKLDAYKYIDNKCVIVAVIAIVICGVLYAVLRYKKKPRMLYIGLIGFLILVICLNNVALGGLNTIYMSILDVKTMMLYRDLLQILVIFQYISIAIVLVRGLGFDIKRFNFVDDLVELNVDMGDDDEVELMLGNSNVLQRKISRQLREFKYYYYENKLFIHIILVLVIGGLLVTNFVDKEVVNKIYEQGESFNVDSFSFNVVNSFITNKDLNGRVILDNDNTFVVVKMNIGSSNGKQSLNTAFLTLKVGSNSYTSDSYYGNKFSDLGTPYRDHFVDGVNTYLFVFEIPTDVASKKMKLSYNNDKVVNLSPMMLDEEEDAKSYKLGSEIDLSNSILGSGRMKITSFDVKEKFPYSYKYEINGEEFTKESTISSARGGILNIKLDISLPKGIDSYTFFKKYAKLKYKVDGEEKVVTSFDNKTPGNYKDGLYLSVSKDVIEASEIWFDITIRNRHYVYTLK